MFFNFSISFPQQNPTGAKYKGWVACAFGPNRTIANCDCGFKPFKEVIFLIIVCRYIYGYTCQLNFINMYILDEYIRTIKGSTYEYIRTFKGSYHNPYIINNIVSE